MISFNITFMRWEYITTDVTLMHKDLTKLKLKISQYNKGFTV